MDKLYNGGREGSGEGQRSVAACCAMTFDICRENVDDYILVSEEEIAAALRFMVHKHHKIVEGAAGVAIASFLKEAKRFEGLNVVIIVCGANISTQKLTEVLHENSQ